MKVAVLYGGKSMERDGSLGTGSQAIEGLKKLGHEIIEVDPIDDKNLEKLKDADIVFNCLAGWYGEDGKLQGYMDSLGIKYTGSGVLPSAIGMNKKIFKDLLNTWGIPTANYIPKYTKDMTYEELSSKLGDKFVIKAGSGGSSIGVYLVSSKEEYDALEIEDKFDDYYAESFIKGTEITSAVLRNKDGELEALPLVEFIYVKGEMYDYTAKRHKEYVDKRVPARIDEEIASRIQDYTKKIYENMGCNGIARVDYIIKDGVAYALEINTSPALRHTSGMIIAWETILNRDYSELMDTILQDGIKKYKK